MFSRFEAQLKTLAESLDPLQETTKVVRDNLITLKTPLSNVTLGKYKLVKNAPIAQMPLQKAIDKGYIGSSTLANLKEFQDLGFVFDKVIFKGQIVPPDLTPPSWWSVAVYGPWVPRHPVPMLAYKVGTIIMGKDLKGNPIAYVRSAGMDAPKVYTATTYGDVASMYRKFVGQEDETLKGMRALRLPKDLTVEEILTIATQETGSSRRRLRIASKLKKLGKKNPWTIHPDGTIDVHTSFHLNNEALVNTVRKVNFKGKFPLKLGKVEGDFSAGGFWDLVGAPKEVDGTFKVGSFGYEKEIPNEVDLSPIKDTIVKSGVVNISGSNGQRIDAAFIPACNDLTLYGLTIDSFVGLRFKSGKLEINSCVVRDYTGLPDPFVGNIIMAVALAAGDQRGSMSLKGMPKTINGNFIYSVYDYIRANQSPTPLDTENFPETINGDFDLHMLVDQKDLLKIYIGDRVTGYVKARVFGVTDSSYGDIDKTHYSKAYIDSLTQHTATHGVNLLDL